MVTLDSFRGVKRPGREVNSFPSGSEIKNGLSHIHTHTHTHTQKHTHSHSHVPSWPVRIISPHSLIYYLGKQAPSIYNKSLHWDRSYLLNSWAIFDQTKKILWTGLWRGFKLPDEGERKDEIKRYILWRQRVELPDWMTHYSGQVAKVHNCARKKIRRRAPRYSRATG